MKEQVILEYVIRLGETVSYLSPLPFLQIGFYAVTTCNNILSHDIEHCFALKKMVQKLIEADLLSFEDPNPGMQIVSVPEQYQQQPRQHALQ